jgi:hypothetical protein
LLFCLCRTCAVELNTITECKHETVADRALVGTWVIFEVTLAVEKGYEIVEFHEVYEYQITKHDPQTVEVRHFVQYINTLLKLKAEASGYPSWVRSPDDEDSYIRMFNHSESIQLDRDAIRPNPAKRAIAKLCRNSIWGQTD